MSLNKCFCEQLGNAFVIGLGDHEIAKVWFNTKDGSKSILTKEEAKEITEGMCNLFNDKYDMSKFPVEEYGDSEKASAMVRIMNSLCE